MKVLWLLVFGVAVSSLYWNLPADVDLARMIVYEVRLPRILQAATTGAGLSLAGLILQAIFSNPLCEPYTLGVSSGAALGSVLAGALGFAPILFGISLPAIGGALAFSTILVGLARAFRGSSNLLLLSGVMLGLVGSSLVALVVALSEPGGIQGALFWLLGDLSRSQLQGALTSLLVVCGSGAFLAMRTRSLDALLLGESEATSLGVSVPKLRTEMVLLSGLLVAVCVGTSGLIGFIGLMIPHFARRWRGSLHRTLIIDSALLGALVLMAADHISRTAFAPREIPVGVLTALLGAPFFVGVVLKKARHA